MVTKRPAPSFACRDCGVDTDEIGEFSYMVLDVVWQAATTRAQRTRGAGKASTFDLLCIGCLEDRLGCRLRPLDFKWRAPITWMEGLQRSARLLDRLGARLLHERQRRAVSDAAATRSTTRVPQRTGCRQRLQ